MDIIQFVATTPEELRSGISTDLKNQLEDFFKQRENPEVLLTRQETADLLKIDISTLWSWTKSGKVNGYGIGNRVYYKKSELFSSLKPLNSKGDE